MTTLNFSLPDTLDELVQEKLDALLQEGLDSGPSTPMTAQDWAEIRLEVQRRGAEQVRQTPTP